MNWVRPTATPRPRWDRPVGVQCVSVVVGAFSMVVIAGCTTVSPGEPVRATTVENTTTSESTAPPTTSSDQELPFAGAPKVDNPLDATRFRQDPCQALTQNQAQSLGLPASGAPRDMPLGNACEWRKSGSTGSATVHFLDRNANGLSAEYQANEDGKYAYFNVLPLIEGYPAVATDIVDGRDGGRCTVVVGVSDKLAVEFPISLALDSIGNTDPCETAAKVAGLALQTMKQG